MVNYDINAKFVQALDAQVQEINELARVPVAADELAACQREVDLALARCTLEHLLQKYAHLLN